MTAIRGNTYPVKDRLKALGAKWDGEQKAWLVPDDKAQVAQQLVAQAPSAPLGVCSKCGKACGAAYSLCLACKPAFRHTRCTECGARPNNRGWPRIYRNGVCSDCYQSEREEREMGY